MAKQRQRRRNAKGELKKEREGGETDSSVMLFSFLSAQSIATVLHRVGIHFNEFAFQERLILFGLVSHSCSLLLFPLSLYFSAPYRYLTDLQITFIRLLAN